MDWKFYNRLNQVINYNQLASEGKELFSHGIKLPEFGYLRVRDGRHIHSTMQVFALILLGVLSVAHGGHRKSFGNSNIVLRDPSWTSDSYNQADSGNTR